MICFAYMQTTPHKHPKFVDTAKYIVFGNVFMLVTSLWQHLQQWRLMYIVRIYMHMPYISRQCSVCDNKYYIGLMPAVILDTIPVNCLKLCKYNTPILYCCIAVQLNNWSWRKSPLLPKDELLLHNIRILPILNMYTGVTQYCVLTITHSHFLSST